MNPYFDGLAPVDRAELARWTAANQRAADEYARRPITATAVCEVCGHTSATALCPTCKENQK